MSVTLLVCFSLFYYVQSSLLYTALLRLGDLFKEKGNEMKKKRSLVWRLFAYDSNCPSYRASTSVVHVKLQCDKSASCDPPHPFFFFLQSPALADRKNRRLNAAVGDWSGEIFARSCRYIEAKNAKEKKEREEDECIIMIASARLKIRRNTLVIGSAAGRAVTPNCPSLRAK